MGYQENYVIDPETEDDEQYVVEKEMESVSIPSNQVSRDYEVVEDYNPRQNVVNEIHEAAVKEGLVDEDEGPIGGENPESKEAVVKELINKGMSKGGQKNKEEYEEKKVSQTKKIMATREILTGMTKRLIDVVVPVVLDVQQSDGSIEPELVDLELKVKRLTESQINHLFNRRMAGKTVNEMTNEELQEDNHFRSNFLAEAVVDPKMTGEEWYNDVPAIATGTIFNAVNEALSSIDNTELFQ